jgi:hypothetical protein
MSAGVPVVSAIEDDKELLTFSADVDSVVELLKQGQTVVLYVGDYLQAQHRIKEQVEVVVQHNDGGCVRLQRLLRIKESDE